MKPHSEPVDVAERTQAEEKLRRSEKQYRDLVETSNDLIWSVDADGRWTFVNRKAVQAIYGYTPEEMLGRSFVEFLAPDRVEHDLAAFERIKSGEDLFNHETVHIRKDGTRVDLSFNAIVVRDQDGTVTGTTGTATDITRRKTAERALQQSELFLRTIIDSSPECVKLVKCDGTIAMMNPAGLNMIGAKSSAEVVGLSVFHLIAPEYHEAFQRTLAYIGEREQQTLEFELITLTGARRFMETNSVPFPNPTGDSQMALAITRDVTEKRQAERSLQESEQRYRLLFERNLAGVFRSTANGALLDCNDSFARILGYDSRQAALEQRAVDFFWDPADRVDLLEKLNRDPVLTNYEIRMKRRDGSMVWVLENVARIVDEAGKVVFEGNIVDITEHKHTEYALRASEAKYRALVDNLEQCVFLKDRELRFAAGNHLFCESVGCSEDELVGKTDFDFYPPETAVKYRADDNKVLSGGAVLDLQEDHSIDGEKRTVRVIKTPVRDVEENIVGVLGIFWDITDQLNLESQLRQAQKMEAIGNLAGGIAHDFNNLLTSVLGNISLVLTQPTDVAENMELLNRAEKAALQASELTKRLLGFSRKSLLVFKPIDLNKAIGETVGILEHTFDPRIRLERRLADDLWPIEGDPGQISQVLMNLALNARDAMPDGGALIFETSNFTPDKKYLRLNLDAKPGEFVCLKVIDYGHGMTPEVCQRIFEPFYTTKEVGQGTGLGLAMAFGIVNQHNGWMDCRSEVGRGTQFELYFPRGVRAYQVLPTPKPQRPANGGECILVVDDEPLIRNLGRIILRRYGYQVLEAEDGVKAVEMYREMADDIGLVILDGTMPRLSGRDTLIQLKEFDPSVRVLFSSGYSAEHHQVQEFKQVVGYINKPYRENELAEKVRECLDKELRTK